MCCSPLSYTPSPRSPFITPHTLHRYMVEKGHKQKIIKDFCEPYWHLPPYKCVEFKTKSWIEILSQSFAIASATLGILFLTVGNAFWVSLSLRFEGLFRYTVGILCNAEWCIRQFHSTISCNITSTAYNHYTNIYPLLNLNISVAFLQLLDVTGPNSNMANIKSTSDGDALQNRNDVELTSNPMGGGGNKLPLTHVTNAGHV